MINWHFPAINWLTSYSLYQDVIDSYANGKFEGRWSLNRKKAMEVLQKEAELEELVRLVGMDALPAQDRLLMQVARMIREDFLHQNAFDERDTYTSLAKQFNMLNLILRYHEVAKNAFDDGATLDSIIGMAVLEDISLAKLIPEDEPDRFDDIERKISDTMLALTW